MIPPNGASMADAARTRENEGPCICEGCNEEEGTCGYHPFECRDLHEAAAADLAVKARKERDL